jgi:hypothetical protein
MSKQTPIFNETEKEVMYDLFDHWCADRGLEQHERDISKIAWEVSWLGGWKRGLFLGINQKEDGK